jgi:uncharacterized protein YutE (UPF0331/DUF86 family)
VPVRAEIVRAKLLDIGETVGRLRAWLPVTLERLERDLMLQWAVEHGLQIAAEGLFDVGSHILAGAFQESVDEYREIPGRLRARGVLSDATVTRLEGLAGFRNVLVHEYAVVDLRRFTPALTAWTTSTRSSPTWSAGSPRVGVSPAPVDWRW